MGFHMRLRLLPPLALFVRLLFPPTDPSTHLMDDGRRILVLLKVRTFKSSVSTPSSVDWLGGIDVGVEFYEILFM